MEEMEEEEVAMLIDPRTDLLLLLLLLLTPARPAYSKAVQATAQAETLACGGGCKV